MAQLGGLQERYADVRAAGGEIVAVSADDQAQLRPDLTGAAEHGFIFPVLSDPRRVAIHAWGLLNSKDVLVPAEGGIAYPATYVLDTGGTVRWRYIGTDLTDRPETDAVLAAFHRATGHT